MMLTTVCLFVLLLVGADAVMPRRTDITDWGHSNMFSGWVDVQGQGAKNDFCRFVGPSHKLRNIWLSCALAGTQGQSQYNYNPPNGGSYKFDKGYWRKWFMADKNGDGRDDYCRCVGNPPNTFVTCMLAYTFGFGTNQKEYRVPGSERCYGKKVIN